MDVNLKMVFKSFKWVWLVLRLEQASTQPSKHRCTVTYNKMFLAFTYHKTHHLICT